MKSTRVLLSLILLMVLPVMIPNSLGQDGGSSLRWDLQITDPDYELVNYNLDEKSFKPYLKKTSWRCQTGVTEQKGNLFLKTLMCDYSVEKAGTVKTIVSCSNERKYSEGFLELYDERKDLTFQVMLTCRVK